MKVFLSHARKDSSLAYKLAEQLRNVGFSVWMPEDHISLGDNWARMIGKALDDAELMVVLLTPKALESDVVRQNIELAIGSRRFERRVFTVFVGLAPQPGKHVPWILLDLPHREVESVRDFVNVAKEVRSLCEKLDARPSRA
jgi:hypothetical protein